MTGLSIPFYKSISASANTMQVVISSDYINTDSAVTCTYTGVSFVGIDPLLMSYTLDNSIKEATLTINSSAWTYSNAVPVYSKNIEVKVWQNTQETYFASPNTFTVIIYDCINSSYAGITPSTLSLTNAYDSSVVTNAQTVKCIRQTNFVTTDMIVFNIGTATGNSICGTIRYEITSTQTINSGLITLSS